MLKISNLHAKIDHKHILKGVNINIKPGEIHVVMGPNGSGKSTLSNAIMGNPVLKSTKGNILFRGKSVLELSPDERARRGIFLAWQYPREIQGISMATFLRNAQKKILEERKETVPTIFQFKKNLRRSLKDLNIHSAFADRYLNLGFSGGEKKKAEILQMKILDPKLIILDEIDSGLDVDALRLVAKNVNEFFNKQKAVLIITHYQRILDYIHPSHVHVMVDGKIVKSGGEKFAKELESEGYSKYSNEKRKGLTVLGTS